MSVTHRAIRAVGSLMALLTADVASVNRRALRAAELMVKLHRAARYWCCVRPPLRPSQSKLYKTRRSPAFEVDEGNCRSDLMQVENTVYNFQNKRQYICRLNFKK